MRRVLRGSLTSLTVVSLLATTVVLLEPLNAGAASGHAPRHVPNVLGLTKADVYAAMRRADLYFQTRGPGSSNGTWASIVAESPRPRALVAWHAVVTFTTSRQPGHALRRLPRLTGLTRTQVYDAMRRASLFFRTVGPGGANGKWRYVLHQTPAAGTLVRWHSTLVVTTSLVKSRAPKKKAAPVRHHQPTTTTTRPRPTTTTSRPAPTTTSTSTSTTTTYPGEPTTSTSLTTTTTIHATTTTGPRPTTTTTQQKAPVRYRIGLATWYSYSPGRCASSYLPYGTRIAVRDLQNGHVVHCEVTDRQGSRDGRVVDLSETDFSRLSAPWRGIVRVKVSW